MSSKEYLKQLIYIDDMINNKQKQINRLRELCTIQGVNLSGMPKSCNGTDKIVNLISKIVDLEKEINEDIDKLVDLKRDATHKINLLNDNRYKLILNKRYLLNETFEKIAVDMNLSWKWIHKLHGEALEELDKIF